MRLLCFIFLSLRNSAPPNHVSNQSLILSCTRGMEDSALISSADSIGKIKTLKNVLLRFVDEKDDLYDYEEDFETRKKSN
mgnify:CR=1 FL=1